MKTLLALLFAFPCLAGEFVNLTFDDPDLTGSLTPIYPGGPLRGNTSELLRGWSAKLDTQNLTEMFFSPYPYSSVAPVGLRGNSPAEASSVLGAYSLVLESLPPNVPTIRLSQQGTIPADAEGLSFFGAGYVQMFVNGERVGDSIGIGPVDVSRWSGQDVNLEFLVRAGESARFDILGWVAVPEPSTWALFGLGVAALGRHLWRRR